MMPAPSSAQASRMIAQALSGLTEDQRAEVLCFSLQASAAALAVVAGAREASEYVYRVGDALVGIDAP